MKAAVLGAGCWGTTFAQVLIDAGTETTLWARRAEVSDAINATHRNEQYLPGIDLPRELRATADPHTAVKDADVVLIALPAQQLRQNLTAWTPLLGDDASLISLMKGIEAGTAERMSQVIQQVTGAESDRVLVLSGPNLAHEIAARHPTATVIAGSDPLRCAQLQAACSTSYLRPYTNADVIGTELAGSVKNVIALACGMAAGMG
jgi:glycerol-3-phosphate dehydrogenase (NAD(P)+)